MHSCSDSRWNLWFAIVRAFARNVGGSRPVARVALTGSLRVSLAQDPKNVIDAHAASFSTSRLNCFSSSSSSESTPIKARYAARLLGPPRIPAGSPAGASVCPSRGVARLAIGSICERLRGREAGLSHFGTHFTVAIEIGANISWLEASSLANTDWDERTIPHELVDRRPGNPQQPSNLVDRKKRLEAGRFVRRWCDALRVHASH